MLSAQVDELRELATRYYELQVGAVKAVKMPSNMGSILREAAETIWELRDDLQRSNAENAKLREERDKMDVWHSKELSATMAENAKLRELVRDMYSCISHANEADWFHFERDKSGCGMSCTVNGESCGLCALADRMRELGIEVDDGVS